MENSNDELRIFGKLCAWMLQAPRTDESATAEAADPIGTRETLRLSALQIFLFTRVTRPQLPTVSAPTNDESTEFWARRSSASEAGLTEHFAHAALTVFRRLHTGHDSSRI
eukprot:scaffold1579_cov170-Pinguiococcus_pyrenoidosus.AAC.1